MEAFGADLDLTRAIPDGARERGGAKMGQGAERLVFPTAEFKGEDGVSHAVYGLRPYEEYRAAAEAAGAVAGDGPSPGVLDAIARFGRMATKEVEDVCGLPATTRMRSCAGSRPSGRCGRCGCLPGTCGSRRTELTVHS